MPQPPEYQYQIPPVPRVPPFLLSVVAVPGQTGELKVMEVAGTEAVFNVTVVLTHEVVLQTFSALTQYVVVELGGLNTVKGLPDPLYVPPQKSVYQ